MSSMNILRMSALAALIVGGVSLPASAQTAKAALKDANGKEIGAITMTQTGSGVLINLKISGLPTGEYAMHIHAIGLCEAPFTTAGGHFNPGDKKHGMLSPDGQHAGDMPNLHVPASGEIAVEVLSAAITLDKGKPNSVFDTDGSAVVIHAGKDDYKTDPTGDAGGRFACGVIQ